MFAGDQLIGEKNTIAEMIIDTWVATESKCSYHYHLSYRILPNKRTPPNKRLPPFFFMIANCKELKEKSEVSKEINAKNINSNKLLCFILKAPGALIRQNTVVIMEPENAIFDMLDWLRMLYDPGTNWLNSKYAREGNMHVKEIQVDNYRTMDRCQTVVNCG